jgi:hypothetical protein
MAYTVELDAENLGIGGIADERHHTRGRVGQVDLALYVVDEVVEHRGIEPAAGCPCRTIFLNGAPVSGRGPMSRRPLRVYHWTMPENVR